MSNWFDRRYNDAHWDHERDLRKHDFDPPEPSVSQRHAAAELIGYCEGIASSGVLTPEGEASLRLRIARALAAFGMPSKSERTDA